MTDKRRRLDKDQKMVAIGFLLMGLMYCVLTVLKISYKPIIVIILAIIAFKLLF